MKINPKVNKRVNESVANCRKVLTEATIELLKQIGVQESQDCTFGKMLIFYQMKDNTSETILADRIAYCNRRNSESFFITSMNGEKATSSMFFSVSNLQYIYNEVRRLVRNY